MELASIVRQYYDAFMAKYGDAVLPGHKKALHAILRCRTPDSGMLYVHCPDCHHSEWRPVSCGNRNCPKCQNHAASQWIDRQQAKLLPVPYFMVTFTLPYELRSLAWSHQKVVYDLLFTCASGTLKDFALNPKNLGAEIGITMVLHTNNRKLDFHPHLHAVIPGGGLDKRRRYWKRVKGEYLFSQVALAKVFRARFLAALQERGFSLPRDIARKWVVDCSSVGKGMSAVQYLSRYLYRGVISEKKIIANKNGHVTFSYIESGSKELHYRTLKGEDFLHLLLLHVLPRGFRRVRDYGFLHGNAKKTLSLVQLVLQVIIAMIQPRPRPAFKCPCCQAAMVVVEFLRQGRVPG